MYEHNFSFLTYPVKIQTAKTYFTYLTYPSHYDWRKKQHPIKVHFNENPIPKNLLILTPSSF